VVGKREITLVTTLRLACCSKSNFSIDGNSGTKREETRYNPLISFSVLLVASLFEKLTGLREIAPHAGIGTAGLCSIHVLLSRISATLEQQRHSVTLSIE
jgi:hypothetical protein